MTCCFTTIDHGVNVQRVVFVRRLLTLKVTKHLHNVPSFFTTLGAVIALFVAFSHVFRGCTDTIQLWCCCYRGGVSRGQFS
jgi:hypothetical protein